MAIANNATLEEAHRLAGYKADRRNADHLRKRDDISRRISEILAAREHISAKATERAIERTAITKERVLNELAKLGFSNMGDYMKVGPGGDPQLSFEGLTRDQTAALIEVTIEDFVDGRGKDARDVRRVKFRLADKKGPLVEIGKELGMFIDRKEHRIVDEFENMSAEQLQERLIERIAGKMGVSGPSPGGIGSTNGAKGTTRH